MDRQISSLIAAEHQRQQHELELIASENYVSPAVMQTYANVYTNKYSEGYPGRRYYGGQVWVDACERLCQRRGLQIFGLSSQSGDPSLRSGGLMEPDVMTDEGYEQIKQDIKDSDRYVNVQPLSGSPANLAVYLGVLQPGDTILGMDLAAGGHLSHGHPLNASGVYYNIVAYGVDPASHMIDYDDVLTKALENKPQMILAGFSAYPRNIDRAKFAEIADQVEARHGYRPLLMADIAHIAGLIAGGAIESPFPYFDIVTTTTHKSLRGPRGAMIYGRKGELERNGKTINLPKSIGRGVFPGVQGGPHEHIIAAKAVAFGEILYGPSSAGGQGGPSTPHDSVGVAQDDTFMSHETFGMYAQAVIDNAQALANSLIEKGRHVVTGGTDNHLIVLDVTHKHGESIDVTGKIAEKVLEEVGLSCNKNMIPDDPRSPLDPSGMRLGTPAVTTRGLGVAEMEVIAEVFDQALSDYENEELLAELKSRMQALCEKFPLPY